MTPCHLGLISPTFVRQAKIYLRTALGKFHQHNYTTFKGLIFANFVLHLPNAIRHKKQIIFLNKKVGQKSH
jgi:hypothetical protein